MADADRGRAYLDKAKPRVVDALEDLGRIEALWDSGLTKGDRTGWPSLDEFYTVVPGQLTVVTGWPSSGKSEWLDALLVNLARQGWCAAIFSPENQPITLHESKMLEKISGKPFGAGPTERIARDELPKYAKVLHKHFRFLEPPEDGSLSPKDVIEAHSPWLLQQAKRGLVMDPWNELEHWRPPNLSETEYVSQSLAYIRNWARRNDVATWIVAHPQKMRVDGKLPIPRPDMISGSQNWWNKADNAITVYRDLEHMGSQDVTIYVQKIRFKHIGKTGSVNLKWDKVTGRYHDTPKLEDVSRYRMASGGDED
jgi:twinkle protein